MKTKEEYRQEIENAIKLHEGWAAQYAKEACEENDEFKLKCAFFELSEVDRLKASLKYYM